ncbi:hypothetical protein GCM10011519_08070 [Marmoricola endophyticus]|uniref:DNA-directed RNA polymerase subunit beta n=1 Tax=Marmoricola endophyticus TaxID=2040280 RepID=A0A917BCP5_9ACTN|nr:hypothetical protein [Marmoricola endophyticus]GGF36926.1 hypothetical protein GCM10011519_08070 [Marmoricola endophyticus]
MSSTDPGPGRFHRPTLPGAAHFDAIEGGPDPADLRTAAEQAATALVRGVHGSGEDPGLADRVVHLAETEGLDALAELWSTSPSDSVAGALWRLFALRTWVYADPVGAAREFAAGRAHRPVAEVVAGVPDPPGPDEVRLLLDEVLGGVVRGDFADVLFRAAAFARVTAGGREGDDGARLAATADELERAGHLELEGRLG